MFALDRSETIKALKMVGSYEDANNCPAIDENFLRVLGITDELKEITLDLVFLVLSLVVAARDGVHSAFIFVLLARLYIVPAS